MPVDPPRCDQGHADEHHHSLRPSVPYVNASPWVPLSLSKLRENFSTCSISKWQPSSAGISTTLPRRKWTPTSAADAGFLNCARRSMRSSHPSKASFSPVIFFVGFVAAGRELALSVPVTCGFLVLRQQLVHLIDDGRQFAGILDLLCPFLKGGPAWRWVGKHCFPNREKRLPN